MIYWGEVNGDIPYSGGGPGVAQCGLRHTWDQPLIQF
jgi:hypothetical protein